MRFARTRADQVGQAASWLLKLLFGLTIAAILVIDFGAVVINRIQASDLATEAAIQAGFAYTTQRSLEAAEEAAVHHVRAAAEIVDVEVDDERDEITVTVRKVAATKVFIHRWSVTEGLADVTTSGTAPLRRPGGRF